MIGSDTPAASRHKASTNQIALAWMLVVSPVTLPIPGTGTRTSKTAWQPPHSASGEDEIEAITAGVSQP